MTNTTKTENLKNEINAKLWASHAAAVSANSTSEYRFNAAKVALFERLRKVV